MRLHQFAYAIVEKSELPGDYCNEREKALLPLLREIKQFGFLTEYPLLTELAEQTGCRSAAFDKRLEKAKLKKNGLWNSGLDRAEFEPLLRIIYEKIQQSQEDYPSQVELHCDAQDMDRKRREITDFFHSQGFAGEYPDFYKTADIPGYHMVSGNHGNVLYCRVKNAQMFIHCAEGRAWNRELLVHFHCGRALTGKRQSVQDIFSCCCQDRGYRWSEWVWGHSSDRALEGAKIAVKKLQLDKLTKEERKRYGTYNNGMDKGVLIAFAVSAFSLPVAMLLTAIVMAISGEWEALVEMRTELIRWEIFTFYATIYGLPLGVFALLARRR